MAGQPPAPLGGRSAEAAGSRQEGAGAGLEQRPPAWGNGAPRPRRTVQRGRQAVTSPPLPPGRPPCPGWPGLAPPGFPLGNLEEIHLPGEGG